MTDLPIGFLVPKFAMTMEQVMEATGQGETTIKIAVDNGELRKTYPTSKPAFLTEDVYEWVKSWPETPPASRKSRR